MDYMTIRKPFSFSFVRPILPLFYRFCNFIPTKKYGCSHTRPGRIQHDCLCVIVFTHVSNDVASGQIFMTAPRIAPVHVLCLMGCDCFPLFTIGHERIKRTQGDLAIHPAIHIKPHAIGAFCKYGLISRQTLIIEVFS